MPSSRASIRSLGCFLLNVLTYFFKLRISILGRFIAKISMFKTSLISYNSVDISVYTNISVFSVRYNRNKHSDKTDMLLRLLVKAFDYGYGYRSIMSFKSKATYSSCS